MKLLSPVDVPAVLHRFFEECELSNAVATEVDWEKFQEVFSGHTLADFLQGTVHPSACVCLPANISDAAAALTDDPSDRLLDSLLLLSRLISRNPLPTSPSTSFSPLIDLPPTLIPSSPVSISPVRSPVSTTSAPISLSACASLVHETRSLLFFALTPHDSPCSSYWCLPLPLQLKLLTLVMLPITASLSRRAQLSGSSASSTPSASSSREELYSSTLLIDIFSCFNHIHAHVAYIADTGGPQTNVDYPTLWLAPRYAPAAALHIFKPPSQLMQTLSEFETKMVHSPQ